MFIRGIFKKDIEISQKIILSNPTHMMSMVDLMAISIETLKLDYKYFLEKFFSKLICMIHEWYYT